MIPGRTRSYLFGAAVWAALFLASPIARAQWVEKSSAVTGTAGPGFVHRHIEVESSSGETAQVDLAVINVRRNLFRLRLVDNPDRAMDLADAMPRAGCLAGTNGGYFDPEFAPMGLRIENGQLVRPLRKARLLTGIILANPGSIRIIRLGEYSVKTKADVALQCGPLLVDGGHPVKGLERTRTARRTIALVAGDTFALGICSGGVAGRHRRDHMCCHSSSR